MDWLLWSIVRMFGVPKSNLSLLAVVLALTGSAIVTVTWAEPAGAAASSLGVLHPFAPQRILDTRGGNGAAKAAVGPNRALVLQVGARGGVPAGASAVVLNVTVTAPTSSGYIAVYPDGTVRSAASNLNFRPAQVIANSVILPLSALGRIDLFNASGGTVQLVADVSGYYDSSAGPATPGAFGALTPARLLDTRGGNGAPRAAVGPNQALALQVTGRGGVPTSGVSAVVLNVTVAAPTSTGYIAVYPDGTARSAASSLNFRPAQIVPNLVVAPVGADGKVDLYNSSGGTVQLIADVSGYYQAGTPVDVGAFGALAPARLLDTRTGTGGTHHAVAANRAIPLQVTDRGGVPVSGVSAVVLNVTVTSPTSSGYISVYPDGAARSVSSALNFRPNQSVPNLVVVPVAANGRIDLYNGSGGTVQLVADVAGYYRGTALSPPAASTSHYLRSLNGEPQHDSAVMGSLGFADAQANAASGARLTLLDIGAQVMSGSTPGVQLTATAMVLSYPAITSALQSYLGGYASGSGAAPATIGIGTNNDGTFAIYPAAAMGSDWAALLGGLTAPAGSNITVIGANDIEAGFAGTESQAEAWEAAFLANPAQSLIFNGSADGCPSGVGVVTALGCANGWTQAQYYRLAGSLAPGRIHVLPQVYVAAQAQQWANIDLAGGGGLSFAGALTEASACGSAGGCTSLSPAQGWAALTYALSTNAVTAPAVVPATTDLTIS
jgi:hypothetical protein